MCLPYSRAQLLLVIGLTLASIVFANPAAAQTYSVGIPASTLDLGTVTSAAFGTTTFTISPTGSVSPSGRRPLSAGNVSTTVTVSCGNQTQCKTRNVAVRIGSVGTPTNRAGSLSNFTVSTSGATATIVTAASGANPIDFTIGPIGQNSSKTFRIGADFPIEGDSSSKPTGPASSSFYVYVAPAGSTPTTGAGGSADANVVKPLALLKASDLKFGRLVRPLTGSGTVTVNALGTRSLTAGVGLSGVTPSAATFSATGQPSQQISISVPSTFTMSNGASSVTVTTITSASGIIALSTSGNYSFAVGGSFPISSATASGAYSGVFTAQVDYN